MLKTMDAIMCIGKRNVCLNFIRDDIVFVNSEFENFRKIA